MARRDNSLKAWCQKNGHMELLQELANDINGDHFYGDYTEFIEYNSARSLCWRCDNGHVWESPVVARTLFGRTCPVCNPQMKVLPVGTRYGCLTIIENTFIRRHEEQSYTHNLLPEGTEKPTVWGYELISKAFV